MGSIELACACVIEVHRKLEWACSSHFSQPILLLITHSSQVVLFPFHVRLLPSTALEARGLELVAVSNLLAAFPVDL